MTRTIRWEYTNWQGEHITEEYEIPDKDEVIIQRTDLEFLIENVGIYLPKKYKRSWDKFENIVCKTKNKK